MMKYSEEEMILDDAEDLSESDKMVIFISSQKEIMKTRLQKISLIYDQLYRNQSEHDHEAYFFGGYSDSIDESMENLLDMGVLVEGSRGYTLTHYGQKLLNHLKKDAPSKKMNDDIAKIKNALKNVSDRNVVGLTYLYYGETATNSTIKESVDRLNRSTSFGNRPLVEVGKEEFEKYLRKGEEMVVR